jgi:hypothetical protein
VPINWPVGSGGGDGGSTTGGSYESLEHPTSNIITSNESTHVPFVGFLFSHGIEFVAPTVIVVFVRIVPPHLKSKLWEKLNPNEDTPRVQ